MPEVEALKALTPAAPGGAEPRQIRTPIAGREGQEVLRRLRGWAAQVGEIKLSDDANPTVSLQLTGVDTESIIEQARNIDNAGNRQRKVREMLFHELGVTDSDELFPVHEFEWRGTARSCEILYRNVRELPDDSLNRATKTTWRVRSTIRSMSMERHRTTIWPACKTSLRLERNAERWCGLPAFLVARV